MHNLNASFVWVGEREGRSHRRRRLGMAEDKVEKEEEEEEEERESFPLRPSPP